MIKVAKRSFFVIKLFEGKCFNTRIIHDTLKENYYIKMNDILDLKFILSLRHMFNKKFIPSIQGWENFTIHVP